MNEPITVIVGNLVDDPELRFTPSGVAVCKFRVLQTPRVKKGDEWVDGEPFGINATVWREYAENVAETLKRGTRVIVQGRLSQRSYEDREGVKRTVVELEVDEVGPSLRYATAQVAKVAKSGGNGGTTAARPAAQQSRPASQSAAPAASVADDPWA